jgi:large subunit ribosomal protein L4e
MKSKIYDINGMEAGQIELGELFSIPVRLDIIKRAVIAEYVRQPYGRDVLAGKRTSAHYHSLRRYRWTMMNREMARMARIHHQGYLDWTARFVPQAVKGRAAHPPKVEKIWTKKINKKEKLLALLSAISATADPKFVAGRGHIIDGIKLPLIVKDDIEKISTTSDIIAILEKIGLGAELKRCKKGPLIVVKEDKGIGKIKAIDAVTINRLHVGQLAPGALPGRLCIWSTSAIEELKKLHAKLRK